MWRQRSVSAVLLWRVHPHVGTVTQRRRMKSSFSSFPQRNLVEWGLQFFPMVLARHSKQSCQPVGQYGVSDLRRIRDSRAKPERILSNIHRRAELVRETIGILYAAYVKCLHPVTSAAIVGGRLQVRGTCDKITLSSHWEHFFMVLDEELDLKIYVSVLNTHIYIHSHTHTHRLHLGLFFCSRYKLLYKFTCS